MINKIFDTNNWYFTYSDGLFPTTTKANVEYIKDKKKLNIYVDWGVDNLKIELDDINFKAEVLKGKYEFKDKTGDSITFKAAWREGVLTGEPEGFHGKKIWKLSNK